jgi:hypothetical protein
MEEQVAFLGNRSQLSSATFFAHGFNVLTIAIPKVTPARFLVLVEIATP